MYTNANDKPPKISTILSNLTQDILYLLRLWSDKDLVHVTDFTRLAKELFELQGVRIVSVIVFTKYSSMFFKIHTRHNVAIFIADIAIA